MAVFLPNIHQNFLPKKAGKGKDDIGSTEGNMHVRSGKLTDLLHSQLVTYAI